jgi:AcrR family transcriptional regulator
MTDMVFPLGCFSLRRIQAPTRRSINPDLKKYIKRLTMSVARYRRPAPNEVFMLLPANRYRPGARQRGEDTRRRILETALALFAAEGFDSSSTRAIAEQAGVNLPAIQYYFGSKEGLYRAAIAHIGEQATQAIAPITARVNDVLDSGAPGRAQLVNLLCEMVDALVTLFLDDSLPERESRSLFVSRVEVEHTAALDPLNETMRQLVMAPSSALVGRLLDRPTDDEQVVLRTLMILGQAKIFCSRSVVRSLEWNTIGEARVETVKSLVHQHTRAICRSLKSAARKISAPKSAAA